MKLRISLDDIGRLEKEREESHVKRRNSLDRYEIPFDEETCPSSIPPRDHRFGTATASSVVPPIIDRELEKGKFQPHSTDRKHRDPIKISCSQDDSFSFQGQDLDQILASLDSALDHSRLQSSKHSVEGFNGHAMNEYSIRPSLYHHNGSLPSSPSCYDGANEQLTKSRSMPVESVTGTKTSTTSFRNPTMMGQTGGILRSCSMYGCNKYESTKSVNFRMPLDDSLDESSGASVSSMSMDESSTSSSRLSKFVEDFDFSAELLCDSTTCLLGL
jgi:hypothetical protein